MNLFPIERTNVAQLFWLRCLAIVGQLATIGVAQMWLGVRLPLEPMLTIVALEALFNALTWLRARRAAGRPRRDTDFELMSQLLVDLGALTGLLFFSGGATNPFVSLYLPGLAIAAAVLPWRSASQLALLSLVAYGALNFQYVPLDLTDPGNLLRLHLAGMWVNFVVSVLLIAWFVSRMSRALRARDAQLARAEQRLLRDERMAALGAQAASVAHELGTPLSTMAVVVGELRSESVGSPAMKPFEADLKMLEQQIALCKSAIAHVQTRAAAPVRQALTEWLPAFTTQWRLRHPQVQFQMRLPPRMTTRIEDTVQVGQILTILLDNAAYFSPSSVSLEIAVDPDHLRLTVCDEGPGMTPELRDRLGTSPVLSTHGGHGMGLYLAFASAARLGGEITLTPNLPHGARAELRLPMSTFFFGLRSQS
ncbi:two-component sensor histidine kinase [Pandoraea terrae]|uniref:histidine kinase n=1 Tax=Pandoraea terrae TaxID=1537710 RepID=A0A5E4T8W8_9BURK|nr:ATP-binding protein [Pandoraea terrae]VVD83393.1 two-component sensor histidine kinase [Pandoraea terrae]